MTSPDLQTRKYPKTHSSYAEYSNNGSIRYKYDRPNRQGFKFYQVGKGVLIDSSMSAGVMVYPMDGENVDNSINRKLALQDTLQKISSLDIQDAPDIIQEEAETLLPNLTKNLGSRYEARIIVVREIGRQRFVLIAGNNPFKVYHAFNGQLNVSEESPTHQFSVNKGDGLLVASSGITEGFEGSQAGDFLIRRALEEKSLDPAVCLSYCASEKSAIVARQQGRKEGSYDPDKNAVIAIRVASIPKPENPFRVFLRNLGSEMLLESRDLRDKWKRNFYERR